jgi:thioredoxin-like negative regulator of GroEL
LAVSTLPAVAVAVLLAAPVAAPRAKPAGIRWQADLETALGAAKPAGKPVMIDFWAEWCGYCHRLDRTTYVDPAVVAASKTGFLSVKVNAEGREAERKIAGRYFVRSLPTIVFVSPGGRQVLRLNGYVPPAPFAQFVAEAQKAAAPVIAWEAALEKDPNDAAALLALGLQVFRELQQTSANDPEHLIPRSMLADTRDLLTRATAHDQGRPVADRKKARRTLALALGAEGQLAETEALLKESLALRPADADQDSEASMALGDLYLHQKNAKLARETFEKTVKDYAGTGAATRAQARLARLAPAQ